MGTDPSYLKVNYNGDGRYVGCGDKEGFFRAKTLPVASFKPKNSLAYMTWWVMSGNGHVLLMAIS
jgi:hypothetical protein